uniref:Rib/alpha-like domain-containing protein n=1 Tax=Arcanobacterium phocae TaxID=131112 RepID=UPI001C0F17A5
MLKKNSQRIWAISLVWSLLLMMAGILFHTPLFAQAEQVGDAPSVTVAFDFASTADKGNFSDNVRVHQWAIGGAVKDQPFPKDAGSIDLKPFDGEEKVNFIVYIGTFDGKNPDIWGRYGEAAKAQTDNISAYPGRTISFTYDDIRQGATPPAIPADRDLYEPVFVETPAPAGELTAVDAPTYTSEAGTTNTPASGTPSLAVTDANDQLNASIGTEGTIIVTPDADLAAGTYPVEVTVTYKDKTTDNATLNVIVQPPLVTVTYDFDTFPEQAADFADNVRVHQWAKDGTVLNQPISKDTGSIKLKPFAGEETVNFIVYVGTFKDGKVDVWKRYNEGENKAQTQDVEAKPGEALSFKYDDLKLDKPTLKDADLYEPTFADTTAETGKATAVKPTYTDKGGATVTPTSGTPTLAITKADAKLNATVADDTITVTPDAELAPGDYPVEVTVTYKDKTTDTVTFNVTVPGPGVTVTYDFTTIPAKATDFADHVRVHQWAKNGTVLNQPISKDTGSIKLQPLAGEETVNFIVYIGTFKDETVDVWKRYNEGENKAQTQNVEAKPGEALSFKYDDLQINKPTPKDTELYTPKFTDADAQAGKTTTIAAPTYIDKVGATVTPTSGTPTLAITKADANLNATVTPDGTIAIAPEIGLDLKQYPVEVTVTYKDKTTDTAVLNVTVTKPEMMDVVYTPGTISVIQGEKGSLSAQVKLHDALVTLPEGTVFAFEKSPHGAITIDPATGEIKVAPTTGAQLGQYDIPVVATFNSQVLAIGTAHVSIEPKETTELKSQLWKLSYADATVAQLKPASVDLTATLLGKERPLPRAVTFAKGADMPSWVTVDEKTGTITLDPDEYVAAQNYKFTVAVTHLDGEVTTVPVKITVTKADNAPELKSQLWKLSYADTAVQQLKSVSVDLTATLFEKERPLPRAVTFAKGADMPSWITVDPKTGKVTANPDEYAAAQDHTFTVAVTHLDGKVTTVPVKITITKADNAPELKSQLWKLPYADTTVQQLKTASVDLTATLFGKERALPRAVTFAKDADMPSWVMVDEKTGTITVKPSEYVELKDYVFHVVVTHLDGKTEKVAVKIKVIEADPETTYPLTPLKPGKHTIPALELTPAQPNAKPQTPKPVETPSTGLAKTGISLTGLAGLA